MRKLEGVTELREIADDLVHARLQLNAILSGTEQRLYRLSVELRKGVKQ